MATELETFCDNLHNFAITLKDSMIGRIDFYSDSDPTFNKDFVPFNFRYCHSIGFQSSTKYHHLFATQTLEGLYSFWVETGKLTFEPTQSVDIGRTLLSYDIVTGIDNYPYKLGLDFGYKKIFLVCGEIYNTIDPSVFDYKINDEMILFFENKQDLQELESRINYR